MNKAAKNLAPLLTVFQERASAEVIAGTEAFGETQVRFLVRIPKGPPTTRWLSIIDRLLELGDQQLATKAPEWTLDISKQYFRRPDLRYGWRLIFQGKDLGSWFPRLAEAVKKVQIRAQQIEEVRLNGSPNRRVGGYTDKVLVGPLAIRR